MINKNARLPPQTPPLFNVTPTSIIEDSQRIIQQVRNQQDHIVQHVTSDSASFENVLLPLARLENEQKRISNTICFHQVVSSDENIRQASGQAEELFSSFNLETGMREDLYKLIDAVVKKGENLDPESHRMLLKKHKTHVRSGLNLSSDARDEFKRIKQRLSQISVEFHANVVNDDGGIWLTSADLDGLPQSILSQFKSETDDGGKIHRFYLPFRNPTYHQVARRTRDPEIRKLIYLAWRNRCPENVGLFKEAVVLRDQAARLLGYSDHATFEIEEKMAKTPENVNNFLQDLRNRFSPGGQAELANLKRIKALDLESQGKNFDQRFFQWDWAYYEYNFMHTKDSSADTTKAKEWFSLPTTLRRMLDIFQHLFGMVFVQVEISDSYKPHVWHDDVQLYTVWNEDQHGGEFLGFLYLDLLSRPGKYSGLRACNLEPGFENEDGSRNHPVAALICDFAHPTDEKPSLLGFQDVISMFHELGHGIHDLVSKTKYACYHGTNVVVDFGEAPSQMLEYYCKTPSILKRLSHHYTYDSTGKYLDQWCRENESDKRQRPAEEIADAMIEALLDQRNCNQALSNLILLRLSLFDMMVHQPASHEDIQKMDLAARWDQLRVDLIGFDGEGGNGLAQFTHPFGSDYDAGYYSYYYSDVYSADIFHTSFKPDLFNKEQGMRYRKMVLEKGGSQDERKTLVDYLGREPRSDAFFTELGIASTT